MDDVAKEQRRSCTVQGIQEGEDHQILVHLHFCEVHSPLLEPTAVFWFSNDARKKSGTYLGGDSFLDDSWTNCEEVQPASTLPRSLGPDVLLYLCPPV